MTTKLFRRALTLAAAREMRDAAHVLGLKVELKAGGVWVTGDGDDVYSGGLCDVRVVGAGFEVLADGEWCSAEPDFEEGCVELYLSDAGVEGAW